tara:strand:- start:951 stop:1160 length:210 start_codon:yes stop_codon:yes gene_type:complete
MRQALHFKYKNNLLKVKKGIRIKHIIREFNIKKNTQNKKRNHTMHLFRMFFFKIIKPNKLYSTSLMPFF